ncbi:hypothetical protein EYF80_052287 [Liparis tanakae]|uniref:Uncharacterized protein n=1 Tax=Liparis tanakae TaxID=230148 RepID=A0A4Z2F9A6_9TELE|nr:hypothetical protein EYF80_052287 [Liparis tanakae]
MLIIVFVVTQDKRLDPGVTQDTGVHVPRPQDFHPGDGLERIQKFPCTRVNIVRSRRGPEGASPELIPTGSVSPACSRTSRGRKQKAEEGITDANRFRRPANRSWNTSEKTSFQSDIRSSYIRSTSSACLKLSSQPDPLGNGSQSVRADDGQNQNMNVPLPLMAGMHLAENAKVAPREPGRVFFTFKCFIATERNALKPIAKSPAVTLFCSKTSDRTGRPRLPGALPPTGSRPRRANPASGPHAAVAVAVAVAVAAAAAAAAAADPASEVELSAKTTFLL